MIDLDAAADGILQIAAASGKPLGVVVAGHNGSGKSTLWRRHLSPKIQIPLINAAVGASRAGQPGPPRQLGFVATRHQRERVAQKGVEAFVVQAMINKVAFATESVFSHWIERADGTFSSKIDLIEQMQSAGYFVLLAFVGLTNSALSVARVQTRVAEGGHDVPLARLYSRFERTQRAIRAALPIADASLLVDNSFDARSAFSVCRVQLRDEEIFDLRQAAASAPSAILEWLDLVSPIARG